MIVNIIFTKGQGSFLAPFPCLSAYFLIIIFLFFFIL